MSDRLAVFRDGHIEQIGRPADVYEHPATEFVASFVGTSNVIATPSGRAVLRPEKIELSTGGAPPGRSAASGRVLDVAYLGMITRYTVELADGRTMTAVSQNRSAGAAETFAPSSAVTVSWDLADAFPLSTSNPPDAESQPGHVTKEQHE